MKASTQLDRRRFLAGLTRGALVAAGVLVIDQIIRFLSFQPANRKDTIITIGMPGDFPSDAVTYVADARVFVGRDERGLYAVDAVCPHLGCLVQPEDDRTFKCPCHGSRFNAAGIAQSGPTAKPLRHLYLELEQDGQLTVDRGQTTTPTRRLVL